MRGLYEGGQTALVWRTAIAHDAAFWIANVRGSARRLPCWFARSSDRDRGVVGQCEIRVAHRAGDRLWHASGIHSRSVAPHARRVTAWRDRPLIPQPRQATMVGRVDPGALREYQLE